jgi:hypothetical protein
LRVWYFVAPSLTRGRGYNLLLLLVLASAVPFGSESRGTQYHILLSQFLRLLQPGGPGHSIYIPQKQGGLDILPRTEFLFRLLLRFVGLRWRYSVPPPHGIAVKKYTVNAYKEGVLWLLPRGFTVTNLFKVSFTQPFYFDWSTLKRWIILEE